MSARTTDLPVVDAGSLPGAPALSRGMDAPDTLEAGSNFGSTGVQFANDRVANDGVANDRVAKAGAVHARGASVRRALRLWIDSEGDDVDAAPAAIQARADRIDWLRALPFILLHVACLGVIWVGVSATAVAVAAGLYAVRMFALTGFYHRYFSHRAFRTSRGVQFLFAVIGASCVQRGPLWWAAHHRGHHCHADTELDPHSPSLAGFLWSHMGWFLTPRAFRTDLARVPDLRDYRELRWLDRFDAAIPVLLGVLLYGTGALLQHLAPGLGTSGPQMLVWGFFISTIVLFHATVTINSLAHRFGRRRFDTRDDSRNNLWLALLTFGEGWHNNHHFYPGSARQGLRWWEVDLTWYGLRLMAALGLVWDLKPMPAWVAEKAASQNAAMGMGGGRAAKTCKAAGADDAAGEVLPATAAEAGR